MISFGSVGGDCIVLVVGPVVRKDVAQKRDVTTDFSVLNCMIEARLARFC